MSDKPRLNKNSTHTSQSKQKKKNHSLRKKLIILVILIIILLALLVIVGNPLDNNDDTFTSLSLNSEDKGNLSISITGDVMFGRKTPAVLGEGNPYRYVSNVIGSSDLLIVNTENPFTTSSNAVKPDVPLKASPEYIDLINGTNYTVLSSNANNHVFDYGIEGMQDSIENLNSKNIAHIGAGNNKAEATEPFVMEKNGHKITVFNYMDSENFAEYSQEVMPKATDNTPGYSAWDDNESPKQIQQARENGSDFIIVYTHYGNEYSRTPNEKQVDISHKAIDAGADTVVGSHAHVTQGMEVYNGKPIFYNLGNFIFDQSNPATHRAYFVNFDVRGENVTANIYPVDIINYLPHYMDQSSGRALLEELNPQCEQLEITDNGTGIIKFNITNETKK